MSSILIAESGATKTDWVLLQQGKKKKQFKGQGMNPYLESKEKIIKSLKNDVPLPKDIQLDKIFFYGAGISKHENKNIILKILREHFNCKDIEAESDLLAAARGLCGDEKGMSCILGTGSNACYYDGKKIKAQLPSLGYIAGDEGSGNYMGKRILQYYAYDTFDTELKLSFEQLVDKNLWKILDKLYREPFPNRYLASFVTLLRENRGHYMVENIIEDCLNDFFRNHIFKYRQSWKYPIHFTGSVAFGFADVIQNLCEQYELELGNITKSPLERLIKYHHRALNPAQV